MTVFQQRVCDYCHERSAVRKPEELCQEGWRTVRKEGQLTPLDRCPVCSFTEDVEPHTEPHCAA